MGGQDVREGARCSVEPESTDVEAGGPADGHSVQVCTDQDTVVQAAARLPFFSATTGCGSSAKERECASPRVAFVEPKAKKAVAGIWLDRGRNLPGAVGPRLSVLFPAGPDGGH